MRRRGRSEWRELCAAREASGLTARAFAEQAGVNWNTLSWWGWRLRREARLDGAPAPGFVEVVAAAPARTTAALVVRVGALTLEFGSLPPAAWLAEVAARC